jgi:hypothetical protein
LSVGAARERAQRLRREQEEWRMLARLEAKKRLITARLQKETQSRHRRKRWRHAIRSVQAHRRLKILTEMSRHEVRNPSSQDTEKAPISPSKVLPTSLKMATKLLLQG